MHMLKENSSLRLVRYDFYLKFMRQCSISFYLLLAFDKIAQA